MNAKLKTAGLLGAAVMAIPGAGLITNAMAADGGSSSSTTTVQQEQPDRQRPDREDCPEKDGRGGGSGSGSGSSSSGGENPGATSL